MIDQYKLAKIAQYFNHKKAALKIASGILLVTVAFGGGSSLVHSISQEEALLVRINGNIIGYVKNEQKIESALNSLERELEKKYDTEITISQENISMETIACNPQFVDDTTLTRKLSQSVDYYMEAAAIQIEGKTVVSVKNETIAQNVLASVKKAYIKTDSAYADVSFEEDTKIVMENSKAKDIVEYEDALVFLLKGNSDKEEHPGETISRAVPVPYLHVITVEKATANEPIEYDIAYEETSVLYKGEEKVKQEGSYGIRKVEKIITRKNGQEIETQVVASEVIQEPSKQIVLVGTKAVPVMVGTGDLANPTRGSGTLTSPFGTRWGREHKGVDIAGSRGTSIYAADAGVVVFSGWKSDYGYLVIIDHGENKTTYYGHCDKLLVSTGDKVERNQEIAKMGDTGRTTGVHLHFEVRINNVPQNPGKYIAY